MIPSVRTIEQGLGVDHAKAKLIRGILDGSRSPIMVSTQAADYLRQCQNKPPDYLLKLWAVNQLLGAHGVEGTPAGKGKRSPALDYVNMGDTYDATVVRVGKRQYRICSWGDIVERGNYA